MDWLSYDLFTHDMPAISNEQLPSVELFLSPHAKSASDTVTYHARLITQELQDICQRDDLGWAAVLAAVTACLTRYTDQPQTLMGLVLATESSPACLPLITQIGDTTTYVQLANDITRTIATALAASTRLSADTPGGLIGPHGPVRIAFAPLIGSLVSGWDHADAAIPLIQAGTFDLLFTLDETDAGWRLGCFCSSHLPSPRIERFLEHTVRLLEGFQQPDASVRHARMLSAAEEREQLIEWNDTAQDWEVRCIHRSIADQAAANPAAPAVYWRNHILTYGDLDAQSNQLARQLKAGGVGPGSLVAVYQERTPALLVTLLAILKAGGAYLPLDIKLPAARLRQIMLDAHPHLTVTQPGLVDHLAGLPGATVVFEQAVLDTFSAAPYPMSDALDNPIYVIYTSGSTGQPKGVSVNHRSVSALIAWMGATYSPDELRRVLASTSLGFDISVFETLGVLCHGGALVLTDHILDLPAWADAGVTLINSVPSAVAELLRMDALPASVSCVNLAGEAAPALLVAELWRHPQVERVINAYGPTETTIYSTWAELPRDLHGPVPIGRPLPNERCYILDSQLQLLPSGAKGQLYIGGVGVTSGYRNRADLTAQRFIASPFQAGDRLYHTGDIASFRDDGTIDFHGRSDQQCKIRGYRVELGEIEAAITASDGVTASVVVENEDDNGKHLIAYVVPDRDRYLAVAEPRLQELPDGLKIVPQNINEAAHLYEVIFGEDEYLLHDIHLADGACVFDVGANIGLFALYVHQKCQNPTVYGFEPVPAIHQTACQNMELYGLNAQMFMYGLADSERDIEFTYYPKWSALSGAYGNRAEEEQLSKAFLQNDAFFASYSEELVEGRFEGELVLCHLRTMSQVIREHAIERIDLVKINVEKSELDVLLGIEDGDWPKIKQLVVEVHNTGDTLERVRTLLERHGFSVVVVQNSVFTNTVLFTVYARRLGEVAGTATPGALRQVKTGLPVRAIHDRIKQRLPEYMIPRGYIVLDQLPLTYNGKLDRRALPPITASRLTLMHDVTYVPPANDLQQVLAGIWQQVLGIEQIGVRDNFFDLGGTSIAAARVHSQIEALSLRPLRLSQMFQYSTIERLANYLGGEEAENPVQHRAAARRQAAERRQQSRRR